MQVCCWALSDASWLLRSKLAALTEVITVFGNLVDNMIEVTGATGECSVQLESIFVGDVSARGSERGMGLAIARQTAESFGESL